MITTKNLKGYWRFEGNALDSSGNGNNGTITSATPSDGKFGKGYDFNASTARIRVTNIDATQPYTVIMWIKSDVTMPSGSGTGARSTFLKAGGTWNPGIWMNDDYIRVHADTEHRSYYIDSFGTDWHMVGQVFDGTNCYLILDGKIDTGGSRVNYSPGEQTVLDFGYETTYYNWTGLIDECQIYDKALSQADVKRIHLGMHPLY